MLSLALRGLPRASCAASLTALAIFFGVAMVAGTLMLTDTINNSFDNIFASANEHTDVTVKPTETVEDSRGGEPPAFSADLLRKRPAGGRRRRGRRLDLRLRRSRSSARTASGSARRARRTSPPASCPPASRRGPITQGRPPQAPGRGGDRQLHRQGGEATSSASGCGSPGQAGVKRVPDRRHRALRRAACRSAARASRSSRSPEAQRLTDKQGKFDEILVAAEPGVSPEQLKQRVQQRAAAVGDGADRRGDRARPSRRTSRTASRSSRPRCWCSRASRCSSAAS